MMFLKNRIGQILAALAVVMMMAAAIVPAVTANDTFEVTVKHQINGKSAGAVLANNPAAFPKSLPVDVYINGDLTFEDFKFREVLEAELPAGEYKIDVTLADAPIGEAIMSFGPAEIPAGVDVTITAKLVKQAPTLDVKVK